MSEREGGGREMRETKDIGEREEKVSDRIRAERTRKALRPFTWQTNSRARSSDQEDKCDVRMTCA